MDMKAPVCDNAWFELVHNMRAKDSVPDGNFYNFDETGFMMCIICAGMVVTHVK